MSSVDLVHKPNGQIVTDTLYCQIISYKHKRYFILQIRLNPWNPLSRQFPVNANA